MQFDELDIPEPIQRAITELGFTELTAVQEQVLPRTLAGEDLAGQGRTGTGKTAAFLITAFTKIMTTPARQGRMPNHPRALIVAPTRELAVQIYNDAVVLGKYTGLALHAVYGGVDYDKQRKAFDGTVDVLIGTPGRLLDYFKQHCYGLKHCDMMIVDEADRMFDLGFIRDIRYFFRRLPPYDQRQALLFSATLSYRVLELAYEHMNNPVKVQAETGEISATGIDEALYNVSMEEKFPVLVSLLRRLDVQRGMIFVNEKREIERLVSKLTRYDFSVGALSGDVPQRKRLSILNSFTSGKIKLLLATDVASRGLHIEGVTHVFNYDLPQDAEDYVHRIGRTARAGASGVAVSFSCERFCFGLPDIEAFVGHRIPLASVDDGMMDIGPPLKPAPPKSEKVAARPKKPSHRRGRPGGRRTA